MLFGGKPKAKPKAPVRVAIDDAVETVKEAASAVKPLQVLSGFVLAVGLAISGLLTTGQVLTVAASHMIPRAS